MKKINTLILHCQKLHKYIKKENNFNQTDRRKRKKEIEIEMGNSNYIILNDDIQKNSDLIEDPLQLSNNLQRTILK